MIETVQNRIPRRFARVDELMSLSHRRTIAMMFYKIIVRCLNNYFIRA